jgi:ParB family transcriptional regulator, chromosome partitioning protein
VTARRGLGRGLGALIPAGPPAGLENPQESDAPRARSSTDSVAPPATNGSVRSSQLRRAGDAGVPDAYFVELDIGSIRPNPRQPRAAFDAAALEELAESLALVGLLQPVVVRPMEDSTFELVMGERRWRAAQRAGLQQIPAIVRHTPDGDLLRDALLENLHRADLNPLEEAAAYQQLLDDFGVSHDELAARIGRSRPHISNTIRLLKLSPAVQRRVAAGVLSAGHARALLSVADPAAQDRLAASVVKEGLSVRAVEELVAADSGPTARRKRTRPARSPELSEIADRLSERFETRCHVDMGRGKGKITIEFADLEDLQRILDSVELRSEGSSAVSNPVAAGDYIDLSTFSETGFR